ncbi:MAG: DUF1830 domain-containing protein [Symploca sp. SIO2C1]|nr:DUF1830 domain-containing protein [Symploca sp. SIO2C1]
MNQTFAPLPAEYTERMLCAYVNGTQKLQIARIRNIPHCKFEQIIFPKQRLLFEALPNAWLEIDWSTETGTTLSDRICCNYLRVQQRQDEFTTGQAALVFRAENG